MGLEDENLITGENMRGKSSADAQDANETANSIGKATGAWIADGGFRRNIEKISLEFRVARGVTPKRVVILGPPLSGKSYLATMLARHYKIPAFRIENVVEAFRDHLNDCRKRLESYRRELVRSEEKRRLEIKTGRVRRAARLRKRRTMLGKQHQVTEGEVGEQMGVGGKDVVQESAKHDLANFAGGKSPQFGYAHGTTGVLDDDDGVSDLEPPCALSPEEVKEVEQAMEERIANSPLMERWRNKIAEMERILLMKVRHSTVGPADDFANAAANSKRMVNKSNLSKKRFAKEQQRRKEEEELLQAKEALQDAPFQDQGLALMLRWRLGWPDCRNQGYILVGFPENLQQARCSFGCKPLIPPATEEEALNPRSTTLAQESDADDESEQAEVGKQISWSQELSAEDRLPDDVLVLYADDEYLLKRWNALPSLKSINTDISVEDCQATGISCMSRLNDAGSEVPETRKRNTMSFYLLTADEVKKKTIETFNRELEEFKRKFGNNFDTTLSERRRSSSAVASVSLNGQPLHSMLNYLECAVTVPTPITAGGRRIRVHKINVQKEPLIPPPAPSSKYELVADGALELVIKQKLGSPHYFGKTPQEVHQETVRRVRLEEEQMRARKRAEELIRDREQRAYEEELIARESANNDLLATQEADRAALEMRKLPLRKFLMNQVMPLLSKGLVEVCQRRPPNPTEYLAEWLLWHNPHDEIFSDL